MFLSHCCRVDVVVGLPAAVDLVCGWVDVLKTELFLVIKSQTLYFCAIFPLLQLLQRPTRTDSVNLLREF